jgi:hypothetical protein
VFKVIKVSKAIKVDRVLRQQGIAVRRVHEDHRAVVALLEQVVIKDEQV